MKSANNHKSNQNQKVRNKDQLKSDVLAQKNQNASQSSIINYVLNPKNN